MSLGHRVRDIIPGRTIRKTGNIFKQAATTHPILAFDRSRAESVIWTIIWSVHQYLCHVSTNNKSATNECSRKDGTDCLILILKSCLGQKDIPYWSDDHAEHDARPGKIWIICWTNYIVICVRGISTLLKGKQGRWQCSTVILSRYYLGAYCHIWRWTRIISKQFVPPANFIQASYHQNETTNHHNDRLHAIDINHRLETASQNVDSFRLVRKLLFENT